MMLYCWSHRLLHFTPPLDVTVLTRFSSSLLGDFYYYYYYYYYHNNTNNKRCSPVAFVKWGHWDI